MPYILTKRFHELTSPVWEWSIFRYLNVHFKEVNLKPEWQWSHLYFLPNHKHKPFSCGVIFLMLFAIALCRLLIIPLHHLQ